MCAYILDTHMHIYVCMYMRERNMYEIIYEKVGKNGIFFIIIVLLKIIGSKNIYFNYCDRVLFQNLKGNFIFLAVIFRNYRHFSKPLNMSQYNIIKLTKQDRQDNTELLNFISKF